MPGYSAWARKPQEMRRALLGPEAETMRRWLAFLRIAVGGLYLYAFLSRLGTGQLAAFTQTVQAYAAQNPLFMARRVLEGFVIPHARAFSLLWLGGELLLGALLVLGLGTRVAALTGVMLHVLYLLATLGSGTVLTAANGALIVVLLVVFGTQGGWRWSFDEMITNRR